MQKNTHTKTNKQTDPQRYKIKAYKQLCETTPIPSLNTFPDFAS